MQNSVVSKIDAQQNIKVKSFPVGSATERAASARLFIAYTKEYHPMPIDSFTNKAINTIRFLAVDGVQTAKAGHPGAPMALAPVAYTLWTRFLRHNPADPAWPNRDRFILSNGHASMLLYSLLHLTGYDLPLAELKRFRQWKSLTAGHPEYGLTPGVETTTGPLGQGFTSGVGMAIAQAHLAALFNKPGHEIIDHFIYAIVSDGDLMEGISSEAASLAAHYKLGRLIYIYDDNHISIEGDTKLAFTEDRMARFEAYGWHTQSVADGNDLDAIESAVKAAQAVTGKPSIIAVRTIIGYGSPNKQGSASSHGAPLGVEEVRLTKENLGWPVEPDFLIPDDVLAYFRSALTTGAERQAAWQAKYDAYAAEYPELAAELQRRLAGELPEGWDKDIPVYEPSASGAATRNSSGAVLNAIAANMPELIGGSADLSPSNKTTLKGYGDFQAGAYENRNFHFGVREHAMAAILNGMAVYGGIRPYGGTFMVFCRLHARRHAHVGPDEGPGDLRADPRQHRGGRRRPDPSAGGTRRFPAHHPQHDPSAPRRRQRNGRGLALRHPEAGRPRGPGPDATEPPHPGRNQRRPGRRSGPRRVHTDRLARRRRKQSHPDRQRL